MQSYRRQFVKVSILAVMNSLGDADGTKDCVQYAKNMYVAIRFPCQASLHVYDVLLIPC